MKKIILVLLTLLAASIAVSPVPASASHDVILGPEVKQIQWNTTATDWINVTVQTSYVVKGYSGDQELQFEFNITNLEGSAGDVLLSSISDPPRPTKPKGATAVWVIDIYPTVGYLAPGSTTTLIVNVTACVFKHGNANVLIGNILITPEEGYSLFSGDPEPGFNVQLKDH